MANTYTWDCRTVDTYPTHTDPNEVTESDVVYNVHWRLTATTEAGIGAEQVTSLKAGLDTQLAELAAPTSVTRTIVDAE